VSEVDPGVKPPRAAEGNAMPVYPEKMRHKGVEAEVIIKIKISAKGEVIAAEMIRGDEPFASAALAAVKTWRYEPATVDGRPAPFVRLVKLPFRLK
jgi:TonB family protein